MFDIGFWELCLVGVVALIVLGPDKLPGAARVAGYWIGKVRRSMMTMRAELERELELEEVNREIRRIDNFRRKNVTELLGEETQTPSSRRAIKTEPVEPTNSTTPDPSSPPPP